MTKCWWDWNYSALNFFETPLLISCFRFCIYQVFPDLGLLLSLKNVNFVKVASYQLQKNNTLISFLPYLIRLIVPNRKHSYPFLILYFRFCKCDVFRVSLASSSKTILGKCCFCKVAVCQLKLTLFQRYFSRFEMRLKSKIVQQTIALMFCFRFLICNVFRELGSLV